MTRARCSDLFSTEPGFLRPYPAGCYSRQPRSLLRLRGIVLAACTRSSITFAWLGASRSPALGQVGFQGASASLALLAAAVQMSGAFIGLQHADADRHFNFEFAQLGGVVR